MNIAEYSIKNKVISWLFLVILAIGGVSSFGNLSRLEDPAFTIKDAMVVTTYPGATPQQVEEEVTYPLEKAIQQLTYVDEVNSISSRGLSQVTVTIVDNDFFCPRNILSNIVTTELDVGYSTSSVSIASVGAPGPECLEFRIVGGSGSLFGGFANISYVVTLIEDEPDGNTGTVDPTEIFNLNNADGSSSYTNQLKIVGGDYDLDAGVLDVYYEYYGTDGTFQYPGTFRYTDGS